MVVRMRKGEGMGRTGQVKFEGLEVAEIEFEITGGGTHPTDELIGDGDEGQAIVTWKCVNVKHPFKAGEVVRVQTLNVTEARVMKVTDRYKPEPKAEQAELVKA